MKDKELLRAVADYEDLIHKVSLSLYEVGVAMAQTEEIRWHLDITIGAFIALALTLLLHFIGLVGFTPPIWLLDLGWCFVSRKQADKRIATWKAQDIETINVLHEEAETNWRKLLGDKDE